MVAKHKHSQIEKGDVNVKNEEESTEENKSKFSDTRSDTRKETSHSKKKVAPTMNFAEYKLNLTPQWANALRVYAEVKGDMDERPREEWDRLFNKMRNKTI